MINIYSINLYFWKVAKFVRVPLRYALNFVKEDPEFAKSTAIVHLIRDPRAVLASRLVPYGQIYNGT